MKQYHPISYVQRWIRGRGKTSGVVCPSTYPFYCVLWTVFGKFQNLEFYIWQFFLQKFPKISKKYLVFLILSKTKKLWSLYQNWTIISILIKTCPHFPVVYWIESRVIHWILLEQIIKNFLQIRVGGNFLIMQALKDPRKLH